MIRIIEPKRLKLAVLASGRGSNFIALNEAIQAGKLNADICVLISDRAEAPALNKARDLGVKAVHINPRNYSSRDEYEAEVVKILKAREIDIVVLAGYMRLVGRVLLQAYKLRVLNIHPALLPSFVGLHAQRQAVEYGVKFSGCTVHLVDEGMDSGPIIMQAVVPVQPDDTEDMLADRILGQEHRVYSEVLQLLAEGRIWVEGRIVHIK
ncbi:MAG: phosphoribosylglycinamide formyltransferase [Syntrophomonadaceae bacterium]|nr:phosphoribosylglycinamide formyltransferase [Syntrophomonadaceae bacterium]